MSQKRGLGKGLGALIPGAEDPPAPAVSGAPLLAPLTAIVRNPRQPRLNFDEDALAELAESIREHGVIQPLIVRRGDTPDTFVLIAGERRWQASQRAGLTAVPVIVREVSDQQLLEVALIENIQRADLSPLETAQAYQHLADDFGLSHEAIALKVGKKRVTVTNTLRLLKLPETIRTALAAGDISEGHARALLALPTEAAQLAAFNTICNKDLTVRQTEALVRQLQGERPPRPAPPPAVPEVDALAERFRERLGTKVTIKRGKRGGVVVLHFYSDEELNALAESLLR